MLRRKYVQKEKKKRPCLIVPKISLSPYSRTDRGPPTDQKKNSSEDSQLE